MVGGGEMITTPNRLRGEIPTRAGVALVFVRGAILVDKEDLDE